MRAQLTYRLRDGVLVATAAGQRFVLTAHHGVGADLGSWTKVQGLDLEWEVVEYGVAGKGRRSTRLRHNVHTLPPRHDCSHSVKGESVIFVDDGGAGFFIHGWPPCTGRTCIVLSQDGQNLLSVLVSEGAGSIRVV